MMRRKMDPRQKKTEGALNMLLPRKGLCNIVRSFVKGNIEYWAHN